MNTKEKISPPEKARKKGSSGRRLLLAISVVFLLILSLSSFTWLGFATSAGDWGRAFRRSVSGMTGICLSCKRHEIDPQLPFVKALSSDNVEATLSDQATAFAKANHLQILLENGSFQYSIYAGGEKNVLFSTPATAQGLADAPQLLNNAVDAKIDQLNKSPLKASFSQENEFVEKQHSYDQDHQPIDTDVTILARRPMLHELYGVEAALKHSAPSFMGPGDKTGIKFYFLKEKLYKGDNAAAYYVMSDKDKRASVMINPGALDKLWITEADAPSWAANVRFRLANPVFWDSIESLLMHELAHNHQSRMGWDTDSAKLKSMADKTGFVILEIPGKVRRYFIKVKGGDGQELFAIDDAAKSKTWYRVDAQGQPLDAAGLAVPLEKAKRLSNDEVRKNAIVTPATDYFDTPLEIFADAMKMFRLGGDARLALLSRSPALYDLIKEEDQKEINLFYGYVKVDETRSSISGAQAAESAQPQPAAGNATTNQRDEALYLRNWSGQVVKATKQEDYAVYAAEHPAKS